MASCVCTNSSRRTARTPSADLDQIERKRDETLETPVLIDGAGANRPLERGTVLHADGRAGWVGT